MKIDIIARDFDAAGTGILVTLEDVIGVPDAGSKLIQAGLDMLRLRLVELGAQRLAETSGNT